MTTTTKKATMATVKSFLRRNADRLFVMHESHFDGMYDSTTYMKNPEFVPVHGVNMDDKDRFGIRGAWFVGGSRNHVSRYSKNGYEGFYISNCCGSFTIAVKVEAAKVEPVKVAPVGNIEAELAAAAACGLACWM